MTFSVLTLNIWNYEGPWKERLPLIRACIESLEPDLIALQEVLVGDAFDQPPILFAGMQYEYEFGRAQDFWLDPSLAFGNLVASRWPLAQTEVLALPQREPVGGCIAVFAPRERGLPGDRVRRLQRAPGIRRGAVHEGMESIEGSSTYFIDAFEAAGSGKGITMSQDNPYADPPLELRIDYIFIGRPRANGAGRVEECRVVANEGVDGAYPSDHYGVFATFSRGSSNAAAG